VSTTVRRDHVVDLVVGNRRPFPVHLDFIMVADHATLRWATVQEVTAGAFAVVSVELQIEVLMPPFMADPVISLLRCCPDTKEHSSEADYRYPSLNIRDHRGSLNGQADPRDDDLQRFASLPHEPTRRGHLIFYAPTLGGEVRCGAARLLLRREPPDPRPTSASISAAPGKAGKARHQARSAGFVGGLPLTMTRALGIVAGHVRDVGRALTTRQMSVG
jgi:hypothetical protein